MLHAQFITAAQAKCLCFAHISKTKRVFSTAVCGTAGKGKSCFQCENVWWDTWETLFCEQKDLKINCSCAYWETEQIEYKQRQNVLRQIIEDYAYGVHRRKKEKACMHVHVYYPTWCSLHLHEPSRCDQSLQYPDVMLWVHVRTVDNCTNMTINQNQCEKDHWTMSTCIIFQYKQVLFFCV